MKKVILLFSLLFCFSNFSFSNVNELKSDPLTISQESEKVVLTVSNKTDKSTFVVNFNSHEEFIKKSKSVINFLKEDGDKCEITITMSVTVTVEAGIGVAGGSVSTTVTGSVTTSCANAVAAGKKLRAQLVAMAGG